MVSDTKSSSFRGPLVLLLCAIVLGVAGVAAGMWFESERDTNPDTVQLSSADIGFAQDMSVHHEQAVLIAQTLSQDVDPQTRVIADQIVVAQTSEITTMRGWLTLFDEPFTTPQPMQWMHGSDHAMTDHGGAPMPGGSEYQRDHPARRPARSRCRDTVSAAHDSAPSGGSRHGRGSHPRSCIRTDPPHRTRDDP